ncbi:alpha/beta hydrolase-fold protein [Hyalangium versicolor]|uniref:alpha/beta hydrolase-fold protein n=1 Tax=Hyalangium versicolor TaxID=2861190 RepID=UPI001CCE7F12|nr:alpha/beta hydrolase-fold protein [Hyalangium versicolor]
MTQRHVFPVAFLLWLTVGFGVCAAGPAPAGQPPDPQITFDVGVPLETTADAEVWISGNHPSLGQWNGKGLKLTRTPDGRYSGNISLPMGTGIEFKVTRGTWETVEKDATGQEISNRKLRVGDKATQELTLTVARWADQTKTPAQHTLTGNVRYLRGIASKYLPRKRDIIVWLPPEYDEGPKRRYPVLYMHDGQNLMDAATSYTGAEWRVDEAAQQLVTAGDVEPLIIVGVYNTEDRFSEYTQVKDTGEFASLGGGNADAYGKFLVEELKPMIDRTFRTKTGPQDTGLAGSSLGGLVTLHLGIKYPNIFRRLGVVSPSVFWGNKDILARVKALKKKTPQKLWVDIGTEESKGSQETVDDTRQLRDALVAEGWVEGKDLQYVEIPGAIHTETAWADRIDDILKYLYPATAR